MAKGVGNAPTSGLSRSCFQDRCSQLVSACLPEMVRVTGVGFPSLASQMPDRNGSLREQQSTCVLLLPRWWPRANARLLLTLHPEIGCQTWTRTKTNGLTDRRATLTPPGNGAAGRTSTCIVPLRRRMPDVFDHGSKLKWSERQDFHLRPPGPKPGALRTELRSEKMADPKGVAPSTLPQTTGRSAD